MKNDMYLQLAKQSSGSLLSEQDRESLVDRARQRAERKIEEREHLRLELKAREYIQVCHEVIDVLRAGVELPGAHTIPGAPSIAPGTPLDRGRVQALKAAMDGSLRLLDRVLPPLKAVEVTRGPEEQEPMTLTSGELMRLAMKLTSIPGEVEEEQEQEKLPWE